MLRILKTHPELVPYQKDLDLRMALYRKKRKQILGKTNTLVDFANAHTYYGFHNTPAGWIYREWAPGADQLYLTGDFNDWRWTDTPMKKLARGNYADLAPSPLLVLLEASHPPLSRRIDAIRKAMDEPQP